MGLSIITDSARCIVCAAYFDSVHHIVLQARFIANREDVKVIDDLLLRINEIRRKYENQSNG